MIMQLLLGGWFVFGNLMEIQVKHINEFVPKMPSVFTAKGKIWASIYQMLFILNIRYMKKNISIDVGEIE